MEVQNGDIVCVQTKKSSPMRWSETHDIILCREIMMMKPYQFRPGSKESGSAWSGIAEDLNNVSEVIFTVSQKSVRDRFRLLLDKHKKKMRNEEAASGIDCEESEIDNLLQNLKEEVDEAAESYNKQTCEKKQQEQADRASAEEVRQLAMENLAETKKRKSLGLEGESSKPKRNTGSDTMVYLKQRAEQEQALRQQELDMKKYELDLQRQQQDHYLQQQTAIVNQLAQQQQLMMGLLEKLVNK